MLLNTMLEMGQRFLIHDCVPSVGLALGLPTVGKKIKILFWTDKECGWTIH